MRMLAFAVLTVAALPSLGAPDGTLRFPRREKGQVRLEGDWKELARSLEAPGKPGMTKEGEPDVLRAEFAQDGEDLYVRFHISPDVAAYLKAKGYCGKGLFGVAFDADGDPATGRSAPAHEGGIDGVDAEILVSLYHDPAEGGKTHLRAELYRYAKGDGRFAASACQRPELDSASDPARATFGPGSVSFRIPLARLGVQPGKGFRILLDDSASDRSFVVANAILEG